ncbi:MAG TPA: rhodanese-like domain-containing protein, partial [Salinimicrobium catena]|nr:rhodanese-like domain-containing protein [Salinimicrobium catena]
MFELIKRLFTSGPAADYSEMIKNGGIILDVRSPGEFKGGHIKGSRNIPLNSLPANLKKLKSKDQPIITCCASGMRSASAKSILQSNGYTNVYN